MAAAQVWTVIALLTAAQFAIVIEMRRMNDRMTDGFAVLRSEIADLRLELGGEIAGLRAEFVEFRAEVRSEFADVRRDLERHIERDHRPSA